MNTNPNQTLAHLLADYRDARERRGLRVIYRDGPNGREYHTGLGLYSPDRSEAIRYRPHDSALYRMRSELA